MQMKNVGSTLGILLGILTVAAGVNQLQTNSGSYLIAGCQMILGAIAYRLAKKRKYAEVPDSKVRKVFEFALILTVTVASLLRSDLREAIATDPVPSFFIPAWILIAYLIVFFKKSKVLN